MKYVFTKDRIEGIVRDMEKFDLAPREVNNTHNNNTLKFWVGKQADYDNIETKDPETLYMVQP